MSVPLPTTTIEAVNLILGAIGEAPVSVLITTNQDVNTALRYLDEAQRELTSKGLWFNTECIDIEPNIAGEYELAPNVYTALPVGWSYKHFVQRGRKLYNLDDNTFIDHTEPLTVEIVIGLEFEDLPEEARQGIFYKTIRRFGDRIIGSSILHGLTAGDELAASAALMTRHLEHSQYNSMDAATPYSIAKKLRI